MQNNTFKIIVIIIFLASGVFGILVFAGIINIGNQSNNTASVNTLTLWGSIPPNYMLKVIEDFNTNNPAYLIRYSYRPPGTFRQDLLEATAVGRGPDLFFVQDNLVYAYRAKIKPIPFASYPVASFKGTFSSAGEVFLTNSGILAIPITIDPLMMYYNRSILDTNNIVYPPVYWDEFASLVSLLTKKDTESQITKSAVALGQFSNVANSKAILATLFMQTGNRMIFERDTNFLSDLHQENTTKNVVLGQKLAFYTSFADPLKPMYTWNKSLPYSSDFFTSNNLAFYFGYAGELRSLIRKNPNLNFSVAPVPQIKNSNYKLTTASVTGIAISSFSRKTDVALTVANLLANSNFSSDLADIMGLVPARRDLLAKKPSDAFKPIFYTSALYSRSWIDPSNNETNDIFKGMVEKVLSNDMKPEDAVADASSKLDFLLRK